MMKSMMDRSGKFARVEKKADKAASKLGMAKDKLSSVKGKAMTKAVVKYADKASKAIKKSK